MCSFYQRKEAIIFARECVRCTLYIYLHSNCLKAVTSRICTQITHILHGNHKMGWRSNKHDSNMHFGYKNVRKKINFQIVEKKNNDGASWIKDAQKHRKREQKNDCIMNEKKKPLN